MSAVIISGDSSGSISLQAPAVAGTTTLTLPATSGTVLNDATCGVCRAWVNFNGTGTVAIRASYNVSSITDNGVGDYTVNFTNALADANYAVNVSISMGGGTATKNSYVSSVISSGANATPTTTACRIGTAQTGTAGTDISDIYVSVFR